ncbi:hypothetical protein BDV29DRAFT_168964 [Aspergillus leporis]|jgi:hypothetical protein|uniref:Uncharacterized protein n=1 Tax=Aspergillus leporis TaxID=41062 RepID=A0A5N5XCW9_9EURO|nr:hypothetical protein BDV29DRAFT_168964 [Aspergillus leporis]
MEPPAANGVIHREVRIKHTFAVGLLFDHFLLLGIFDVLSRRHGSPMFVVKERRKLSHIEGRRSNYFVEGQAAR